MRARGRAQTASVWHAEPRCATRGGDDHKRAPHPRRDCARAGKGLHGRAERNAACRRHRVRCVGAPNIARCFATARAPRRRWSIRTRRQRSNSADRAVRLSAARASRRFWPTRRSAPSPSPRPPRSTARSRSPRSPPASTVYIEKPLTLNYPDALAVAEAARAADRVMMTAHILQFHNGFRALKELVTSGRLGEVRRVHANRLNLGAVRKEEDALWCLAPHDVSMTLALMGGSPETVEAFGEGHLRRDTADAVTMRLGFPGGRSDDPRLLAAPVQGAPHLGHRLEGHGVFDDCLPWDRKVQIYPHQVSSTAARPPWCAFFPPPSRSRPRRRRAGRAAARRMRAFPRVLRLGRGTDHRRHEALAVMDVLHRSALSMTDHQVHAARASA